MTFKIANVRFIERFRHTTKYLGSDDIVFSKGVYPYSYMTDR